MNILLLEENETHLAGNDPRAKHIRRILKLGLGDSLRAGIVNGPAGEATIVEMDPRHIHLVFHPGADASPDAAATPGEHRPVDLLLGHPRPIVLRRMLRDLCTIGIRRLTVVPTDLGERSYLRATMWNDVRPYLIEGAAQAGTTRLMEVDRFHSFAEGVRAAREPEQRRVVLHMSGDVTLQDALRDGSRGPVLLAIGSERGWTDNEVEQLTRAGFTLAGLGDRILRTETAALVACWTAHAAFSGTAT